MMIQSIIFDQVRSSVSKRFSTFSQTLLGHFYQGLFLLINQTVFLWSTESWRDNHLFLSVSQFLSCTELIGRSTDVFVLDIVHFKNLTRLTVAMFFTNMPQANQIPLGARLHSMNTELSSVLSSSVFFVPLNSELRVKCTNHVFHFRLEKPKWIKI